MKKNRSTKRLTQEQAAAVIAQAGGKMVGTYVNASTPVETLCACGETFYRKLSGYYYDRCKARCEYVSKEDMPYGGATETFEIEYLSLVLEAAS